jgi:hypothetical protein
MVTTVYKSTDASAPVLTGLAGTLVTVLDACLVNGYGAKSAAGWTKPFSAANQGAYRMNSATGAGHYLNVVDSAPNPTLADGREARLRGFETMSAMSTGTGLFPTAAQFANGLFLRKSATDDATARPWVIVADDKTVVMFVNSGDYGSAYASFYFGEFFSLKSSADAYRTILIARTIEQIAATPVPFPNGENLNLLSGLTAAVVGHYVPRTFSQFPQSAVNVGKHGNAAHSAASLTGLCLYPNPVDGGLYLAPLTVHEPLAGLTAIRGRLRGLWHFCHPASAQVNDGDTFAGAGPYAGKSFLIVKPASDGTSVFVIETTSTWETN